jgi:hypothetical protein
MENFSKNNQKKQALCATKYQTMHDRHGVAFTFDELEHLAINPLNVEKSEAPLIHPSSSRGKTKEIIKRHNLMTWLWIDLDSGNKPLSEVINICKTYQITNAVIYSTASACREKKNIIQGFRWRVVILPNQSLCCDDWHTMQRSLAKIFKGGREACNLTQGFFAPSNNGGFYEYSII